jgi:2-polyprenyl-3-methyl-5-hydroxy-6-metoxy-1,4-benzoquinol methylase
MTVSEPRTPPAVPSAEPIMQMLQAHMVTGILRSGVELGVFDRLTDGPRSAAEVAREAGADERGMRILLDALTAVGLLDGTAADYRLTPLAATFLVSSSPAYLGGLTRIFSADHMQQRFMRLSDAVRSGGAVTEDHAETPQHPWWEEFAASVSAFAAGPATELADILAPWAAGQQRLDVLDVACGSGVYGHTLAMRQPQARVWSLDWSNVLATTRRNAEGLGLADRAAYIPGDMFEASLGGPYDAVVMSHVLHHFDEERCVALLRRVAEVTRPGGRLAIQDFVSTGDDPARDIPARMFSAVMLVWTRHGEAPSLSSLERMLAAAGFGPPSVHGVPHLPTSIVVAERAPG